MRFLYNNLAVIVTALTTSLMAWIYGGTRSEYLLPVVPWLIAIMLETLFFFPQKEEGESSYEARARVWKALKKDTLVWIAFWLMVLLSIPFFNKGLCPNCDRLLIKQGVDAAPGAPFLPFCVNLMEHLNVYFWFAVSMLCMLVTKHSLNTKGKRLVVEMIVWNGFALAILGFIQLANGAPGPFWSKCDLVEKEAGDFFSTFGYPNMAGDYFTTLFCLAAALWRYRDEDGRTHSKITDGGKIDKRWRAEFRYRHYMLIPTGVFFFAALNTLSRAAIMLVTFAAFLFFAHTLLTLLSRMHRAKRVKVGVWSTIVMLLLLYFASVFMPEDMQREVHTISADAVLTRVSGKAQYHSRVATAVWKDHKLFGCGGWGYKHFCITKMTPEELKQLQVVGGINVHNDYLQFMAEHGLVGLGLMIAAVVLLIIPVGKVWRRLAKQARFTKDRKNPIAKPVQVFAMPAPVFFMLTSTLCTFIHSFGDCPLRSPAVMSLFFINLAALPGFLPRRVTGEIDRDAPAEEVEDEYYHHHHGPRHH